MAGYNSRARKRNKKMTRTRVVSAFARRRREMQDREGRHSQPGKRATVVEIADERNHAMCLKLRDIIPVANQAHEMNAMPEPIRNAQRDVAAAYEQYTLHRTCGAFGTLALQRRAACDARQEPSTLMPTQLQ